MRPELIVDNDAGARAVSARVKMQSLDAGAYVIFSVVAPSADGFWIGCGDGVVRYVPADRFNKSNMRSVRLQATPLCGVISVDGKALMVGTDDGRITRVAQQGRPCVVYESDRWIERLVRKRDKDIYAGVCGRIVVVLDADGSVLREIDDHPSTGTGLAFSPDGKQLAVAHYDGVSVWDVRNGKRIRELYWHGSHTGVSWAPDGRYIVTTTQDKELHGWRMPDGVDIKMSGYPTKIRSMSWTADARYLIVSGADTVTSWNFEGSGPSGKPPLEFGYVFNGVVTQVAAHPQHGIVAAGYNNGTVLIGSVEHSNAWIARPPGGGAVATLCWHPGGEQVLAGSESGALSLMSLEPGFCEEMFS